jgi:hypothetical protein
MGEPNSQQTPERDQPAPNMRRHLLFGLALLLAFGSMYAGILGYGTGVQFTVAIAAAVAAVAALSMKASPPQEPPPAG